MKRLPAFLLLLPFSILIGAFSLVACSSKPTHPLENQNLYSAGQETAIQINNESPVVLAAPNPSAAGNEMHLTQAVLLPGRGMNLFQLQAQVPGHGTVDLLKTTSLQDAQKLLNGDSSAVGNLSFSLGGAFLIPYANRIRGPLNRKNKTIRTRILGHKIDLPANWKGEKKGAELHAMHGLILKSKCQSLSMTRTSAEAAVDCAMNAADFGVGWPSKTELNFHMVLRQTTFIVQITAKNVGTEPTEIGIGWHPYFNIPGGHRQQAQLVIPARTRALANNYDDTFPTGKTEPVQGTRYDFTNPSGTAVKDLFMDDSFTDLNRNAQNEVVSEILDPESHLKVRIKAQSPQIRAIQVYAPPKENFFALEPQFNLADPENKKIWKERDTGMVQLQPGDDVTYSVEIEIQDTSLNNPPQT